VLLDAAMRGEDTHAQDQLLREYRAEVHRCRRRQTHTGRNTFLHKSFHKDHGVYQMLKQSTIKHVTPVSESSWHNHLSTVFKHTTMSQFDDSANHTGAFNKDM
jgi:F0F1-type ATP synthase beta subunit